MRPKLHRLMFFALETILVAIPALATAGRFMQRKIENPIIALVLGGLFVTAFFGMPIWCAIYRARERRLERIGAITLIGVILSFFF